MLEGRFKGKENGIKFGCKIIGHRGQSAQEGGRSGYGSKADTSGHR